MFYNQQTKYVSFLPGGFEECHQFIERHNLNQLKFLNLSKQSDEPFLHLLMPHNQLNCYHCTIRSAPSPFQLDQNDLADFFNGDDKEAQSERYNRDKYQLQSSTVKEEEMKQSEDETTGFDIFTGFRHWW